MKINELRELLCGLGLAALLGLCILVMHKKLSTEQSNGFVGYSQSCWQVGDTLHVITAKGDTVRLGVSKLYQQ